jgi:superfamily II DNA/RNA helicase
VATDIAARGIDVLRISHVINYDMPENTDAYTNRIGRTGRVDKNGDALTFVTSADTAMVRALELILQAKLERRKLKGFDYTVSAAPNKKYSMAPHRLQRSIA